MNLQTILENWENSDELSLSDEMFIRVKDEAHYLFDLFFKANADFWSRNKGKDHRDRTRDGMNYMIGFMRLAKNNMRQHLSLWGGPKDEIVPDLNHIIGVAQEKISILNASTNERLTIDIESPLNGVSIEEHNGDRGEMNYLIRVYRILLDRITESSIDKAWQQGGMLHALFMHLRYHNSTWYKDGDRKCNELAKVLRETKRVMEQLNSVQPIAL